MRSARLVLAAVLAVAGGGLTVRAAAGPISPQPPRPIAHGRALSPADPVLTFAGEMQNPAPAPMANNPDPTVCVEGCELWGLHIATHLPVLVSIHNGNGSIDDGFDLTVYDPRGNRVATANGIGANGQAVVVHPAQHGTYTVAVTMTYAYDVRSSYLGEARVMSGRSWRVPRCPTARPCPVLPAFTVRPAADVHVNGVPPVASTPLGFPIPLGASTPNSCYTDETARTGATRCLRFTSEIDNTGMGLLHLRIPWAAAASGAPQSGFAPGECHAQQVITMTDGSQRIRPAGPCEFHQAHAHFHYMDLVEYSLHRVTAAGRTGATVARSLKESFCLADDGYFGFAHRAPNGPRTYVGQPDCNIPSPSGATSGNAWVNEGITPGWGDIYTWDTPDQFIDISDVRPGVYDIVSRANPVHKLELAGNTDPCATTRIRLTATAVKELAHDIRCR
ncbi:MAG: hypothetical protein QOJ03_45 [Frankiaceae bacterium]|nr:hypothetical protein [Frankiaceae bacterium]